MKTQYALAPCLLLAACGGGTTTAPATVAATTDPAPATTPAAPTPAPAPAPVADYSPFEGLWSGPTTNTAAGYPGLIVDADGVYWLEDVTGWMGANAVLAAVTGTLGANPTATQGAAATSEQSHGGAILTLTSAAVAGGTLTINGDVTGSCAPAIPANGTFDCYDTPIMTNPWSYQAALVAPAAPLPVSALAGSWTTTWGSALTINTDGTFVLTDEGSRAVNVEPSGCQYAGQITIKDPATNVYSVTATVTPIQGSDCTGTAVGVLTVLPNGQLAGGLAVPAGVLSVMDTESNQ